MLRRFTGLMLVALLPALAAAEPVRFDVEVMAVLSRAGCNQGACHGNLNGKGGFKLSLRGEDPAWDFAVLTRDNLGRRINLLRPDDSLALCKPTATIAHEGGRRFEVGSREYRLLRDWIAAGARRDLDVPKLVSLEAEPVERIVVEPEERVPLRVRARWANGCVDDVTHLACFEASNPEIAAIDSDGVVRKQQNGETAIAVRFLQKQATVRLAFVPARPGFRWANPPEINYIDRHVFAKLKTLRVNPSELCDDATFVRRAFIDAIGTLPTADETQAFLRDARADKRSLLIDALLRRPEFADLWALRWSDLLRSEEKVLDRKGVEVFHAWIRRQFAEGRPLNEFARDLIAARGSTYADPPANYYRALRDPLSRAEATAQVFLGVRVQCARCHNHPFDRWTQDDYYRLAAFFPRVQYRIVENNRKDKFDKHEFDGEQVVWVDRAGEVRHPRNGASMSPAFLASAGKVPDDTDRLLALADWVANPANPFFGRTQANRIWAHLMGRGLVDPVDDFRATNPPSHPALLDELAADFASHRFDLRYLVRTILNSRTYQLAAQPNETNAGDATNFSHALVRRLDAEVMLDAVAQIVGIPVKFDGQPLGVRAIQLPGVQQPMQRRRGPGMGERFMKAFGKPDRLLSCECERNDDVTIPQTLQMLTGEVITKLLQDPANRIGRLLAADKSDREIIDELYLAAISRRPTPIERESIDAYLKKAKSRRDALEDVAWALLNSKEFMVRK
jgi:hypothetical protein